MPKKDWERLHRFTPEKLAAARLVLDEIRSGTSVMRAIQNHPLPGGGHVAKHVLVAVYHDRVERGEIPADPLLLARIRMKPMRSLSGVTTVTVLTQPHPCPGECIFCPEDVRMPKSYLPDEPAAARALENKFDPFVQVRSRLDSLTAVGHPTDKVELLVLGGTWNAYPADYQEWFIQRCLDALNQKESLSLEEAQTANETAPHRNVGLSVETRPDEISPAILARLRELGVTKVQMGAQSFNDAILENSRRGHTTADTLRACALLRAAGFKIVLHWMPNLPGATLDSDREDFSRMWKTILDQEDDTVLSGFCPDEIKIYPTQLLENTELYQLWQRGEYQPYTTEQLIDLIADIKSAIPAYCRVNRIIRDIPSEHVVAGNKRTSLRQDVLEEVARRGQRCRCIRCREVRAEHVHPEELELKDLIYYPAYAEEHFLSFVTPQDRLAGYLRLSLPMYSFPPLTGLQKSALERWMQDWEQYFQSDLKNAAIIREVHIYGQALPIGSEKEGAAQHIGLGTTLLQKAEDIARLRGYSRMAVIAAIGTRPYYANRGFKPGNLYMVKDLEAN